MEQAQWNVGNGDDRERYARILRSSTKTKWEQGRGGVSPYVVASDEEEGGQGGGGGGVSVKKLQTETKGEKKEEKQMQKEEKLKQKEMKKRQRQEKNKSKKNGVEGKENGEEGKKKKKKKNEEKKDVDFQKVINREFTKLSKTKSFDEDVRKFGRSH